MKTAYINGNIYTMDINEKAWGFIEEDGMIIDVIENQEDFENQNYNIVDLKQRTVLPGFNDSHLHCLTSAQKMRQIDLSNAKSIDDVVKIAKNAIDDNLEEGTWIVGRGWNQDYFKENRFLTKDDLNRITTKYPLVFIRACIHICVVNSKALEIINLDPLNLPNLKDGEIYLDEKNELLGLFSESALDYVYRYLPKLDKENIKKLILDFQKLLNSQGITSIQTDDFTALNKVSYETIMDAYKELALENKLTIKVYQQCLLPKKDDVLSFLDKGYNTKKSWNNYQIGPLKLLLDGSLGARTAALRNDYFDMKNEKGILIYDEKELNDIVKIAYKNNMQLAIHGIGDKAIEMIIDSYEKLNDDKNINRTGIVHCQITDELLIQRIINNNICIYAQPIFLHYDIHMVDKRVGKQLGSTSYAFKTLMDNNVSVSLGSDSPVESTNPFANIYCAITRNDLQSSLSNGWNTHESLSIKQALKGYTIEGAYQSFEDEIKGSITKAKVADFIVIDKDIMKVKEKDILDINVLETYLDGKLVYKK